MADKRDREGFRVQQYSERLAASPFLPSTSLTSQAAGAAAPTTAPCRVILAFDADAFYAQVEEKRNPSLRTRPLAVEQKYLVVTANYVARAQGVKKLMGTQKAKQLCPGLVLVSGEDLLPYRAASKEIFAVLRRYGPAQRLGLDEVFVDATEEVRRRVQSRAFQARWHGHVHCPQAQVLGDNAHRPMDLRVERPRGPTPQGDPQGVGSTSGSSSLPHHTWLMVGSAVAAEARAAVKAETGYRTSCGIAPNKMLAKLTSGLHKPDDQTAILPQDGAAFLAALPPRAVPGIGFKADKALQELGVATVADVAGHSRAALVAKLGPRAAQILEEALRGEDSTVVKESAAPQSITTEDSFKGCASWGAVAHVLAYLCPDLLARLREDALEHERHGTRLTVKWRRKGSGWARTSASCALPAEAARGGSDEAAVAALHRAALAILKGNLTGAFDLTLLNIGVTAFSASASSQPAHVAPALRRLLGPPRGPPQGSLAAAPPEPAGAAAAAAPAEPRCADQAQSDRRLAQAAQASRRDFSHFHQPGKVAAAAKQGGGAFSKHAERLLRERGERGTDSRSTASAGAGGAGASHGQLAEEPLDAAEEGRQEFEYEYGCEDSRGTAPVYGGPAHSLGSPAWRRDGPASLREGAASGPPICRQDALSVEEEEKGCGPACVSSSEQRLVASAVTAPAPAAAGTGEPPPVQLQAREGPQPRSRPAATEEKPLGAAAELARLRGIVSGIGEGSAEGGCGPPAGDALTETERRDWQLCLRLQAEEFRERASVPRVGEGVREQRPAMAGQPKRKPSPGEARRGAKRVNTLSAYFGRKV